MRQPAKFRDIKTGAKWTFKYNVSNDHKFFRCKTKYTSPLAATIFAKNESLRAKKNDGAKTETGGGTIGEPAGGTGGTGGGVGDKTVEEFMCVDGRGGKHEIGKSKMAT